MELLTMIGHLSSFMTISSGIQDAIQSGFQAYELQKLKKICGTIDFSSLSEELAPIADKAELYLAEKKDYIFEQSLFSSEEKTEFIEAFLKMHTDALPYRQNVEEILLNYFNQLEFQLLQQMSVGDRVIHGALRQIKENTRQILDKIDELPVHDSTSPSISSDNISEIPYSVIMQKELESASLPNLQKQYLQHFHKPLFTDGKKIVSLAELYIPNKFMIAREKGPFGNLIEFIFLFLQGRLPDWLSQNGIHAANEINTLLIEGYQCTGKSTLLSKILDKLYSNNKSIERNIHFLSFSERDLRNRPLSPRSICDYLNISLNALTNATLLIDAIDESNWATSKAEEQLELLISDLRPYQCKLIITSRYGYLNVSEISSMLSILLQPFTIEQADEWIDIYHTANPSTDVNGLKCDIRKVSSDIRNLILIPYIFHICVTYQIKMGNVVNLCDLYDLVFRGENGFFLRTPYSLQERNVQRQAKQMMKAISQISICCLTSESNMIKGDLLDNFINQGGIQLNRLKTEYLLYQKDESNYAFAHNSIPNYFVALYLFNLFSRPENQLSDESLLDEIKGLIQTHNVFTKSVMSFIEHFSQTETSECSNRSMRLLKGFLNGTYDYYLRYEGTLYEVKQFYHSWFNGMVRLAFAFNIPQETNFQNFYFFEQMNEVELQQFCNYYGIHGDDSLDFLRPCSTCNLTLNHLNLSGAYFYGKYFRSMVMYGAKFEKSNLAGAYFLESDLSSSSFEKAHCTNAEFINTVLCSCSFRNAQLNGALFSNCNLANADMRGASFHKCKFENCVLAGMKIEAEQLKVLSAFELEFIRRNHIAVYLEDCLLPDDLLADEFQRQRQIHYSIMSNSIK